MGLSLRSLCFCGAVLLLFSCGKSSSSGSSGASSFFASSPESAYCTTSFSYASSVTVSSRAQYYARQVSSSGLQGPMAAQDIKFAEVLVLDAVGNIVQCGETDALGNISLQIPKITGSYILQVNSRADNSHYKVSVLNNPSANNYYSMSSAFNLAGNENTKLVSLAVAPYNGTLEGGAFNILDQIYKANEFIRNNSTCASQGNVCTAFTVAPKSRVYWSKGISPAAYFGSPSAGLSFFSKSDDFAHGILRGMYILGGIQGNIDCSDTDHFDNSVILHEYGHFLEDAFAKSNSPGGSHSGNGLIDPRLAWSEGWANFIQGAIRTEARYRDTIGNSSCSSGSTYLGVNLDLQNMTSGQDAMSAGTTAGEGTFREVSVSRTLYRSMASSGANIGFPLFWKIFTNTSSGFADQDLHFRNIGQFNEYLSQIVSTQDPSKSSALATELSNEYQLANTTEYAQVLRVQPGASCTRQIQGVADANSYGSRVSNQLKSNDFFAFYYDGSQPVISLKYAGAGTPSDLDLYVYKEDYVYGESSTIVARSEVFYPEVAGTGQENVNLTGQPAGWYLINIKVDSDRLGNMATYYLETPSGARLCP